MYKVDFQPQLQAYRLVGDPVAKRAFSNWLVSSFQRLLCHKSPCDCCDL